MSYSPSCPSPNGGRATIVSPSASMRASPPAYTVRPGVPSRRSSRLRTFARPM